MPDIRAFTPVFAGFAVRHAAILTKVQLMLRAYPYPPRDCRYAETAARAVEQFSDAIVAAATNPVHGAPRRHKDYPPSAGQLVRWCEDHMPRVVRIDTDTPRFSAPRPSREELEARLGRKIDWSCPARLRSLPAEATLAPLEDGDFSRLSMP